ncbi:uncharacterized protein BJX67DRAFT_191027 [Aspergillus lucknowensis]|uniref:N-acetyltransferase domain-containing protein n=1 Tax=Aspergillus lucknowensis TaxID=176173 RepID=A0ABR4LKI5_9EURO
MACSLVPINLNDPAEYEELRQQRILCGWDFSPEKFALWRQKQEAGLKSFFWITKSAEDGDSDQPPIRAGHISLDAFTEPPDWDLANSEKTNLTIQTFFILPQHRSGGLGRTSMKLIEAMATKKPYGSPNCEYITLNCLSKKHYYDEVLGPYVRERMSICNEEWYERQGYVSWKVEPRYEDTLPDKTTPFVFEASFMRKRVKQES